MTAPGTPQVRPRSLGLLVATGALAATVVVLVLVFGVARPPALASLAENPDPAPTASVAWIDRDDGDPCLHVAAPDGTAGELTCDLDLGVPSAWDADGIRVRDWDAWEEERIIDPVTGEELGRRAVSDPDPEGARGDDEVRVRTRDGRVTVTVPDTGSVVWEADAHENYYVQMGVRSPDGAWVVLLDSADRLLVVPADGSVEPRVWTEAVTTWDRIIWEGTEVERAES